MALDPARLLVQLQNTGLQNKDNPLYQLLFQLITTVTGLNNSVSGGSSSGSGSTVVNNLGQILSLLEETREEYIITPPPLPNIVNNNITQVLNMGDEYHEDIIAPGQTSSAAAITSTVVYNETPGGSVNGSNTAFTTANSYVAGSLRIFLNGVRLAETDYTETGATTFSLGTAPVTGDLLRVDYNNSASSVVGAKGNTGDIGRPGFDGETVENDVFINVSPPSTSSGSGNTTSTTAVGSEPGSPVTGDLDLYSNGFAIARYSGSAWNPWGPNFPFTKPVDGDFAWINQGGASVSTTNGGIYLLGPATAGTSWRIRKKALGANTRLELCIIPNVFGATPQFGLLLRESATGKLATLAIAAGALQFAVQHWASATGAATNDLVSQNFFIGSPVFLAMSISGANLLYHMSSDGQNWIQLFSIAKTSQFTTAPDEWGFALNSGQATYNTGITLASFKES